MGISKDWENFFDAQGQKSIIDTKFAEVPVAPEIFFRDWMKQPLFPEQLNAINAIFTPDFKDITDSTNELLLMYGEGAGKDFLCERILIYVAYWLNCLKSPQKYLNRADGTPIDLVNTSVTEEHAANVFFKQFCEAIPLVINPNTGNNWFSEQGMDIRAGKDIQTSSVKFPKFITAYSCSSVKYTAEGKNVFLGILDEIAEFRYEKAKALYTNLKATCTSRFPQKHKVVLISYLRDEFDFMNTHWNAVENLPLHLRSKVYRSNKATWEVNLNVTKESYADAYEKDPEDSARRYENIMPKKTSLKFIKNGEKILKAVRGYDDFNPLISATPYISTDLNQEIFAPWFKPYMVKEIYDLEQEYMQSPTDLLKEKIELLKEAHSDAKYFIHIDLAKGAYDYAGFALVHSYRKTPTIIGYYVDFVVQLKPEGNEVDFEKVRDFVYSLQDKGFDLTLVSLDQWNSTDFMQQLTKKGIPNKLQSVDRSLQPYNTLKDLLYQELISFYGNPILLRELNELQLIGGKVDHPKESMQRLKEEGKKQGSKDCADAVAGAIYAAIADSDTSSGAIADPGACGVPEDVDDMLDKMFPD